MVASADVAMTLYSKRGIWSYKAMSKSTHDADMDEIKMKDKLLRSNLLFLFKCWLIVRIPYEI
jgi:hypothetical protein